MLLVPFLCELGTGVEQQCRGRHTRSGKFSHQGDVERFVVEKPHLFVPMAAVERPRIHEVNDFSNAVEVVEVIVVVKERYVFDGV